MFKSFGYGVECDDPDTEGGTLARVSKAFRGSKVPPRLYKSLILQDLYSNIGFAPVLFVDPRVSMDGLPNRTSGV